MITYYKRTIASRKLRKLEEFQVGCWINVISPSKEEIADLTKKHHLDEDLLEEGLDENELPRIDIEEQKTYIFVKTISPNNSMGTILLVLGKDFLLTIAEKEPLVVKEILAGKKDFITTQKLKSIITILALLNDEFEKAIMNVVRSVQRRRKDTARLHEHDMGSLLQQEEFLNNLSSMYFYTNLLYSRMIKRLRFFDNDKDILEDLMIESEQNLNLCKTSLKTISNIRDYYSIALSNKLNKSIKALTILTVIISIPAAVSGLYGMNVKLPLQEVGGAFWFVLGIIVLIWTGFLYFVWKKKIV